MQYLNATYIIFNFKLFVSSWMFFLGFGVAPIPFSLIDVWFQSGQTKQLVNSLATVTYFAAVLGSLQVI